MKEKKKPQGQNDLFRSELKSLINLKHELVLLSSQIDWKKFETRFASYFPSKVGKPALSTRLILGVLYLKYAYNLSDEEMEVWVGII